MKVNYSRADITRALEEVGVRPGDVVISASNVGYFGMPEGKPTLDNVLQTVLAGINAAIGDRGTFVINTFSYSFLRGETFDVERTPSTCGVFSEYVRRLPNAMRSVDPIASVAAIGARARELTTDVPAESHGRGSVWERILDADGIVCNLNLNAGTGLIHYVERICAVPYRQDRWYSGIIIEGDRSRPADAAYYCRDLSEPGYAASYVRFDKLVVGAGLAKRTRVGRGNVTAIRARDVQTFIEAMLPREPLFLTVAGAAAQEKLVG